LFFALLAIGTIFLSGNAKLFNCDGLSES